MFGNPCTRLRRIATAAVVAVAALTPSTVASAATAPAATSAASVASDHLVVTNAPDDFVVLKDIAPTIVHDIRYHGHHNFIGRPIVGYREPLCILTRDAAEGLARAQQAALAAGYTLKVYDCFRPQRAVDDFVRWAARPGDQRMKQEFYPRVDKSKLFEDGYIAERSGHSRGSTVDLTLVKLPVTPQRPFIPGEPLVPCYDPNRFPDNSIDMGTGYDCFDTLAHTLDERITGEARQNRLMLKQIMEDAGFVNYEYEWWHYTLANEPYPDTYFDFPVARKAVS